MRFELYRGLPSVTATVTYQGRTARLSNVVLDTGSQRTVFSADRLALIGLVPQLTDQVRLMQGVGGTESVLFRQVDSVSVGDLQVDNIEIQVSGMQYNPDLGGLIGMDFLARVRAIIDLDILEIRQSQRPA